MHIYWFLSASYPDTSSVVWSCHLIFFFFTYLTSFISYTEKPAGECDKTIAESHTWFRAVSLSACRAESNRGTLILALRALSSFYTRQFVKVDAEVDLEFRQKYPVPSRNPHSDFMSDIWGISELLQDWLHVSTLSDITKMNRSTVCEFPIISTSSTNTVTGVISILIYNRPGEFALFDLSVTQIFDLHLHGSKISVHKQY